MDELSQGTPVPQVAAIHHRTRPLKKLDLRAQESGTKFVTSMWYQSLRIWQFHNDAFHGDANTQVKCYKQEELEQEKGRLKNRHIELQPILHRFRQKHFESPDTVNNLRYDIKNAGQPSPNSFSTRLNPDSHPKKMNSYHGV
jgi:hypothetical protein